MAEIAPIEAAWAREHATDGTDRAQAKGPVGPDDEPFVPTTLAPGTYPDWNPDKLYAKGDKILLDGLPYEARWPNQGDVPQTLLPVAPDSAWNPLFTVPGEPASP